MTSSHSIAFVEPGFMGGPMTGQLARAGHGNTVCKSSCERAERWRATLILANLNPDMTCRDDVRRRGSSALITCLPKGK